MLFIDYFSFGNAVSVREQTAVTLISKMIFNHLFRYFHLAVDNIVRWTGFH